MNNPVVVEREQIEAVRNTLANGGPAVSVLRWAEAILEAQPAEAEGVDFGFDDRSVKVSQEAYSIFLDRERHRLAALSAVTAERDRLREALRPFSAFEAVRSKQGGCTPKSGTVWAVALVGEEAEITVEHLQEAVAAMAAKEA